MKTKKEIKIGIIIVMAGMILSVIGAFDFKETSVGYFSVNSALGSIWMLLGYIISKLEKTTPNNTYKKSTRSRMG